MLQWVYIALQEAHVDDRQTDTVGGRCGGGRGDYMVRLPTRHYQQYYDMYHTVHDKTIGIVQNSNLPPSNRLRRRFTLLMKCFMN